MKSFIFCIIFFLASVVVFGQSPIVDSTDSFKLSSVEVSSGKGAVTSGLYGYVNLENKKAFLTATISANDLEITYLYRLFNDKVLVGPNAGYFMNAVYGGAQMVFSPSKYIETFHWFGWSLGKPDSQINLKQSGFLFAINSVSLKLWRLKATYCLINYMKNPLQQTVTLRYDQKINTKLTFYTTGGYDFLNKNQLLQFGVNYRFR